ncbi:efflux transporter, RND family, MFP subunit, partial [Vibrio parahaemolyticus VPTS-2010]
TTAQP